MTHAYCPDWNLLQTSPFEIAPKKSATFCALLFIFYGAR
jgi:hypothetical protein